MVRRLVDLNEWVCSVARADGRLEPAIGAAATIEPALMTAELHDKLERYRVRAIKIHPALNFTLPSHPGYEPIVATAREAGLVVVAHGGASVGGVYDSPIDYCAPENLVPLLVAFPEVKLVVAHFAHPHVDMLLDLAAEHRNLYTDLSYVVGAGHLAGARLRSAVRAFGVDRVLSGSDFPYFDPEQSLDRLASAGFGAAELEAITAGSIATLIEPR